jgi:iron-sulfur cluster assembly protein|tara:strand:+ start:886 stop:1209 length:324 start_codon:yes stop_codon:yes gene_type:complete
MEHVTVTEKAKSRLIALLTEDKPNVELSVLGGGCSGLSYSFKYTDREIVPDDKVFDLDEFKLIVPFNSYIYVTGTEIDFNDDLLNGGFIFNNPQAARDCGCGISFSI